MIKTMPEWLSSPQPIAYREALTAMEMRVDNIIANKKPELIWLLQHPPLYTAGTSADQVELKDEARFPVYETGRGGRYTYHGPGQRVIYAMIDLRQRGKDIRAYIDLLETWIINVLSHFDIKGEKRTGRVGIWVTTDSGEEKIAALGIRIRKWVAYHGLSFNVSPDLSHFSGIVPCGLSEYGVTSLAKLGIKVSLEEVDDVFRKYCPF